MVQATVVLKKRRGSMLDYLSQYSVRFRQKFTLEDAVGSHACSLEANMRVTNGIPLGSSLLLPVHTVNCVQTLKVFFSHRGNARVLSKRV
jgi:hypothetical protein